MKKHFLLFALLLITLVSLKSQDIFFDIDNPISVIDFSFINEQLVATVTIGTRQANTKDDSLKTLINNITELKIFGIVHWNETTKKVDDVFNLDLIQKNDPYKRYAIIATGEFPNSKALTLPMQGVKSWRSISNIQVKYKVNGKEYKTPSYTFNPFPFEKIEPSILKLVATELTFDRNNGNDFIAITLTHPANFQLTSLSIKDGHGAEVASTSISDAHVSTSGKLELHLKSRYNIEPGDYSIEGTGILLDGTGSKLKIEQKMPMINSPGLRVVTISKGQTEIMDNQRFDHIEEINLENTIDFKIKTNRADARLASRFKINLATPYNSQLAIYDKIGSEVKFVSEDVVLIKIFNLKNLPTGSSVPVEMSLSDNIFFSFTIEKKAVPVLTNFAIALNEDNNISIKFALPKWADPKSVEMNLKEVKDVRLTPTLNPTSGLFERNIDGDGLRRIGAAFKKTTDTTENLILEDEILIKFGENEIFNFKVKFFNYQYFHKQITNLERFAKMKKSAKKREDVKNNIEKTVKTITEGAEIMSGKNPSTDGKIKKTVDKVVEGKPKNGEKQTREVIGDVLGSAAKLAPYIIPLFL